ncbi:nitroreductase family protein [Phreatobacter cathodiphilus]|uniref:Nitroreductase family protein n=1 Tax=Phreatobacter cathodiphilus TaxID=1868589 RepID=A0A2S0N8B3_9HYPH|nr:nitroreductase family protein [Phreatobacter cathodiphilus]AVO44399.1 nitroreductase family protein [Phreatobacter cathodiphilus]
MTTSAYVPVPLPDHVGLPEEEMQARADAFLADIRRRHTVRDFSGRPVPRALIETCIRAAGTAPNGANHQPWHFCVIGDPAVKRRIREAAEAEEREFYAGKAGEEWLKALGPLGTDPEKPFLETAPWLIAVFGARRSASADGVMRKNYYVPESVSIAVGFLIVALHRAGLVSLTHTPAPMGFLNAICGRPADEKPYILMVVGHPAEGATIPAHALEKKPLEAIASFL